jgi:iron complex transport system substrate-binding protein
MRKRGLILVAVLLAALAGPAAKTAVLRSSTALAAGDTVKRAIEYLRGRQQSDGGFAEPGSGSSVQLTTWTVCAIASDGQDLNTWRKSGKSPLDYLGSRVGTSTKLTDLEKVCLAVGSAGGNPRSFAGRNLVADIKAHMAGDGHIGGLVNEHCWGVIALAAAGERLADSSRSWLVARQDIDGGFGFSADSGSDPDDTGAALQALLAAGESAKSKSVSRALSYLHFCQSEDGGFAWQSDESNVGSTAWAVQGLAAAGESTGSDTWAKSGGTPLDYLAGMQKSDGHIRYRTSSDSNPAWMTAEAIPALLGKPFPLKPKQEKASPPPTSGTPAANATDKSRQVSPAPAKPDSGQVQGSDQSPVASSAAEAPEANTDGNTRSAEKTATSNSTSGSRAVYARAGKVSSDPKPVGGLVLFLLLCAVYVAVLGFVYLCLRLFLT